MEPVSAVFGIMAALPQCIQSAKDLYDLKSRYNDASILISAIYSESMVIAASLSQVQNLLQHDGLQSKPQLLETLDRALTGCRVVYGCLEEEVRDLVAKTEANDLKFKDRAKFLWKEDTFKELLTQIRGQQSALSLLIQGLQMESIADIKKLVENNSVTLDQVVKRSRTLRQSHPRIQVPDSLFDHSRKSEEADAESIVKATEFAFDDEVINSRAYRRAMAIYTSREKAEELDEHATETERDAPPAYETPPEKIHQDENTSSVSTTTIQDSSFDRNVVSRKALRKPLPMTPQSSDHVLHTTRSLSSTFGSPTTRSTLQNNELHAIWMSIIDNDRTYIERMTKFRKMFYDNVLRHWPRLEKHLEAILACQKLAELNKDYILSITEQQVAESESSVCDPAVFEHWMNKAHKTYREYCQQMPHAVSSLRITQERDAKFRPFVNTIGLSLAWFGKSWEDYIKLPLTQLDLYTEKLQNLINVAEALNEPAAFQETRRLQRALGAIEWLQTVTTTVLEDAEGREAIQNLEKRIHTLDATIFSQLRLLDSTRRVIHQGSMAIKLKSEGSWQAVHVMLLDNFLLWGKVKTQKKLKGDQVIVLDTPLPVDDLEVIVPSGENNFQKATMFDEIPRGSLVYTITIRSRKSQKRPHLLGALGLQDHKVWMERLTVATTAQRVCTPDSGATS
ncbi:hypothetical protein DE146DRAFT_621234 [Phaeosphaeria sp. MPI-PUGE-AT-0046c]|nr:hypothetical protein DE146DRAFT_621234 [Phaeosphaeria sp. MPI-PUGE-AT-0046c]